MATLLRAAEQDDAALAELRSVTSVDAVPVDLDAALVGVASPGSARSARLEALAGELSASTVAGTAGSGATDPDAARQQAREVLDQDKFQATKVPKPFKGPLEWLADRLRPIGRFFGRLVDPILALPGGAFILGSLLVGLGAALTVWLIGRRSRAVVRSGGAAWSLVDEHADPDELERRAEEREAEGDHRSAIRLRYQAGLLRLVRADRLTLRPDTTAGDAARQVGHPVMDDLTEDFEGIVYGDRTASAADADRARAAWSTLTAERARR